MKTSNLVLAAFTLVTAAGANAAIGFNRFQYQAPAGTPNATHFKVITPVLGGGNSYSNLILRRAFIGGILTAPGFPNAGGATAIFNGPRNNNAALPAFDIVRNNNVDVYTRTILKDNWSLATRVDFYTGAGVPAIAADAAPVGGWRVRNLPEADSSGIVDLIVDASSPTFVLNASVYRGMSYSAIESAFDTFFNISMNTPDIPADLLSNPTSHFSGATLADSFNSISMSGGDTLSLFISEFGADEGVIVAGTMDMGAGNVREFAVAMAVPTPGAAALLSLAGLCTVRRRR